jgi:hypothetical protein
MRFASYRLKSGGREGYREAVSFIRVKGGNTNRHNWGTCNKVWIALS